MPMTTVWAEPAMASRNTERKRAILIVNVRPVLRYIPRSSAHGLLRTLERRGYVQRKGLAYRLGNKAFEVGMAYSSQLDLIEQAQDILNDLHRQTNETISFVIRVRTEILYLLVKESNEVIRVASSVGTRIPAHVTGVGRAILATMGDEEVRALYRGRELETLTQFSMATLPALLTGLAAIRIQGFAFDNQGAALGAQSVACAVHDRTGAAVAGLSIATPVARMSRDRFARLVRDGAREMSRRLGFQDPVRV